MISKSIKNLNEMYKTVKIDNNMKIDIRIIYGKNELQPDENNWLKSMTNIRSLFCKDLHAKCYLNEKEAIIASMNLYEFSQVTNHEMGIYIQKETDPELYQEIFEEAQRLIRISDDIVVSVEKVNMFSKVFDKKQSKKNTELIGYCIRTGVEIPFDVEKPFSYEAYKKWNESGDIDHPEKYCHFSGEPSNGETNAGKPILKKNWKKAKEIHDL